nr:hypothetical protein [Tanacetum cinerariifolium]
MYARSSLDNSKLGGLFLRTTTLKEKRFLIASRFPTPPLACAFFSPGATVTSNPSTLGEAFFKACITEARFEDEQTATTIVNLNDLNIAIPDQVLEESILHSLDKVEAVPTSMVVAYEEHRFQDSMSGSEISESGISGLVSQLRDAKDEQYQAMIDAAALKQN